LSLRLRLALFGAAVVALTLVLFGSLLYALLARSVNSNQDDALRSRANQAATSLGGELAARAPVAPADLRSSTDVFIEVLAQDGTVLYSSAVLNGTPPVVPDGLRIAAEGGSGSTFVTVGDASRGTQLRLYAVRSSSDVVVAGQSTRVPASNLSGVLVFLIISAVPTLLAALAASWLVAGRALKPLREVAATADEIGRTRDFGRRLAAQRSRDEVSMLSASFNRMLVALEDAFESQRRFVADASHELRTPLATIQGNAGLLAHGPEVADDVRRAAALDIAGESERMARLTDRLLTLARADSGLELALAPVELRPLVAEAARQVAALHPDTTIKVEAAEVSVSGDEDALRQLVLILLDNATRHARESVSITLGAEAGWARLMVADDGPGIPAAERELVFRRFYKGDKSRAAGGAGLGLAIARWIADQHKGRIIAGAGPDGGAAFFVDIKLLSPS
jgi:two-component system, OmpR family, sensor kinase